MPDTFELIASVTVGSGGASSIDFTSIPSTYTDLCVKLSLRSDVSGADSYLRVTFNGSSSNVSGRVLYGYGSSTGSFSTPSYSYSFISANGYTSNTFGNLEVYVPNYSSTSTNKSFSIDAVAENNATTAPLTLTAGLLSSTSAISSMTFTPYNNSTDVAANFVQYSTATLYGIKNS